MLRSGRSQRRQEIPIARMRALTSLTLENKWLSLTVLPEVGAKIYDLLWKQGNKHVLWHNPRIAPQTYAIEAEFDNYWCGGWDDAFPTGDECVFKGQRYPGLGELRSLQWTMDSRRQDAGTDLIQLSTFGPISPVKVVKRVAIEDDAPVVRIQHSIHNLGPMDLDFIWGTHPAVAITPDTVLRIPTRHAIVDQCNDPKLGRPGQRYDWPILETEAGRIQMDRTRDIGANLFFGHYAVDLEAGWYAIEDARSGEGFLVKFPLEKCPYLWLWLNYGGWRGLYHVIIEPWTSLPVNLAEAVSKKTNRTLHAGEEFTVEIKATVYCKPETWKDALKRVT